MDAVPEAFAFAMHVHVSLVMRTTIELDDEHRAKLLEISARRGEKGFSGIIGEALDAYLDSLEAAAASRKAALRLKGVLSAADAEALRRESDALRRSWR